MNNHHTLFGGRLMSDLDQVASISAARHSRSDCVTASIDSIDFLHSIKATDSVSFESYVTCTGTSSMEIFVKIIAEGLKSGERKIAATAFLTFVALDEFKQPISVPKVIPQTEEEIKLHQTSLDRKKIRKERKEKSKDLAAFLTIDNPWNVGRIDQLTKV